MTKTLLLLGASAESYPIIQRARDMGLTTVIVDGNANAPGMALADVPIVASCYHTEPTLMALCRAPVKQIDGVLCAAIDAPHVAAAVRAEYGLPGLNVEAARLSVDKFEQKTVLRRAGIPVPDFQCERSHYDLMPGWVIKPTDSRGARGVIRLSPDVNFDWAFQIAYAMSPTGQTVTEKWLDGPQYSTESIIIGGKVVFTACGLRNYDRLNEFAPYVIEDGFDVPSIPPCGMTAINDLITRAAAALDWLDAAPGLMVKGDLIWHEGELVILELAARLSGGYFCSHVTPMAYGVDFVGVAIRLAIGERWKWELPQQRRQDFVSQRYVFPDISDIGRRVHSLPPPPDWAAWATWLLSPGDVIKPVTSHAARWGQACFVGGRLDEARGMATQAVAEMKKGIKLE